MSFSQFLQKYSTISDGNEKSLCLKQFLEDCNKLSGIQLLKGIQQNYDQIQKCFAEHPIISYQFLFANLATQDCFKFIQINNNKEYQLEGNGLVRLTNQIVNQVQNNQSNFFEWFSKMYKRYSPIEKLFVFLKIMSSNINTKVNDQFYSEFLADFIQGSAAAITHYLKLKAESPKFDFEYIEHGEKIVKFTQTWIKSFYIELFKNLRVSQASGVKKQILNALSDIITALLEIQREGNIEYGICQEILFQCYEYVKKNWSLSQLHHQYMSILRLESFNIQFKKVVIPEKYPTDFMISKVCYSFLSIRFLLESERYNIYSNFQIVNFLIVALNEVIEFDFDIKKQITKLFLEKMSHYQLNTCFESRFPLVILWFNVHHLDKNNQECITLLNERFGKLANPIILNSLKILASTQIDNCESQISEFIASKIVGLSNPDSVILIELFNKINFTSITETGQKLWQQILTSLLKSASDHHKKIIQKKLNSLNKDAKIAQIGLNMLK